MLIRLLVSRAGPSGVQSRGEEIDVEQAEAVRMIDAGQALPVRAAPRPEKAVSRTKREKAKK